MKKLFYCASLFAALTLASCGGKSTPSADADSLNTTVDSASADTTLTEGADATAEESALPEDATELASSLDEKLSSGDAKGVASLLEQAKAKAAELAKTDPEKASEYVTLVQEWVKKNASTLKEKAKSVGDAALSSSVAAAISNVTNLNAKDIVNELGSQVSSDAKDLSSSAVNTAKEAIKSKVSESNVGKAVETAKKAKEVYDNAPETAKKAVKDKVSEKANEAVNKGLKSLGL